MAKRINDGLDRFQRYALRHPEKVKAIQAAYREKNIERIRERDRLIKSNKKAAMTPAEMDEAKKRKAEYDREYRRKNKEKRKALADAWRKTDACKNLYGRNYKKRKEREGIPDRPPANPMTPEQLKEYRKQYWRENKEALLAKNREWRNKNRNRVVAMQREYYRKNKRAYIDGNNRRNKARRKVDIEFRILSCLRNRLGDFVSGKSKSLRTREMIGCSLPELRHHLESQFQPGMTWENHGRGEGMWHIDHIKALSLFVDIHLPEVQKAAFHWSNLRPLWSVDNVTKGNRWAGNPIGQLPLLAVLATPQNPCLSATAG